MYLPLRANTFTFRDAIRSGEWATIAVKAGFVLGNLAVLVAALYGLWQCRLQLAAAAPIWSVPLYLALSQLPMYVEPRYGLPLEPYLLMLAAIGLAKPVLP